MKVSAMNWQQMETYLQHNDLAVVPLGSTEQHAYLSLATDSILAEKMAEEAADPFGIPVFPVVSYGITPGFTAYPGTLSLKVSTYVALIQDLLDGLRRHGFHRVLFVNGHGGNHPAESAVAEWKAEHPGVAIKLHDWWNAPKTLAKVQEIDPLASHASWMENFPWTRLAGVEQPVAQKPLVNFASLSTRTPRGVRELIGDGSFGGDYEKSDEAMLALWHVGIEETRDAIKGPWH